MRKLATERRAVLETRLVHDVQRRATAMLATASHDPSVPITPVAELRDFLVPMLHHHHESEDGQLWPRIVAVAPEISIVLDALSAEHRQLEIALDVLDGVPIATESDRALLTEAAIAVRDVVHQHLEREEPVLLPALRTHVSEEEWARFAEEAVASAPPDGIHLFVGFLHDVAEPDDVERLLATFPPPARRLVPELRARGRATLDALRTGRSR